MSETKHSSEPWTLEAGGALAPGAFDVTVDDGRKVLCSRSPWPSRSSESFANGRRIVACVNACAGIPTEALEAGAIRRLTVAADRIVAAWRGQGLGPGDERLIEALGDAADHAGRLP